MPHNVRTHTRTTASGKQTTVNQHTRAGGRGVGHGAKTTTSKPKRKPGPNPQHAWKLAKTAHAHGKARRKAAAAAFGLGALLEIVAYLVGNTVGVVCAVLGAILVGLSVVLIK